MLELDTLESHLETKIKNDKDEKEYEGLTGY
jgi:hypothetical protein